MAIADKILQVNQVKQDIKTAIEGKGVSMTGVPFTGYPAKIDSITTGTGTGMSYHDYAKMFYSMYGFEAQFTEAWTESQNSLEVLFEIPLMLAAANQDLGGYALDLYVGTNSALTDLYNLVAGGEIPDDYAIIINKSVIRYQGDISSDVGMPFPVYAFGMPSSNPTGLDQFLIADLTPAGMGLGIVLGKVPGVVIPDNSITIRRGFEKYWAGLIIPEMIEIVGDSAFELFNVVNGDLFLVPFIIGHNVKYIGMNAFGSTSYRFPLNIPDSVEWIGMNAFGGYWDDIDDILVGGYRENRNYIVIPKNVTYIGPFAFYHYDYENRGETSVSEKPVVVMYPDIPPAIDFVVMGSEGEIGPFPPYTGKIYVPDASVIAYRNAWPEYEIKAISTLPRLPYHQMGTN